MKSHRGAGEVDLTEVDLTAVERQAKLPDDQLRVFCNKSVQSLHLAGSSKDNVSKRNAGTNLMIVGVVWQVATLVLFAGLVIQYAIHTRKAWAVVSPDVKALLNKWTFKGF